MRRRDTGSCGSLNMCDLPLASVFLVACFVVVLRVSQCGLHTSHPHQPPGLTVFNALVSTTHITQVYFANMRQSVALLKHVPLIKFVGGPHPHCTCFSSSNYILFHSLTNQLLPRANPNHIHVHQTGDCPRLLHQQLQLHSSLSSSRMVKCS